MQRAATRSPARSSLPSLRPTGGRPVGGRVVEQVLWGEMGQTQPRVLVVEDDPLMQGFLTDLLEPHGYAVEAVPRASCLGRLAAGAVDLVLLDLGWPEPAGLELCFEIRALRTATPPAIVALTEVPEEERAVAGFAMGPNEYVTKPFEVDALVAVATRHCPTGC